MSALFTNLPDQSAPRRLRPEDFPNTPSFVWPKLAKVKTVQDHMPKDVVAPEEHRRDMARKIRTCMSGISEDCQRRSRRFKSEHAGHRICDECKASPIWTGPVEFSVLSSAAF